MVLNALGALLLVAAQAAGPMWSSGEWTPSGSCAIGEDGSARRTERREVACVTADGRTTRAIDCDPTAKPASERISACTMDWSCAEWREEVYAEGDRVVSVPFAAGRGTRIPATTACANAKQADPSGVHSCRASISERTVETLRDAPTSFSGNGNYAWIGCARIRR